MDAINAFGSKVIVERETKKESKEGFYIEEKEEVYIKGKIISVGKLVAGDLADNGLLLEPNAIILYPVSASLPLGLDFPETYEVVEAENVIGIISQVEGNDG